MRSCTNKTERANGALPPNPEPSRNNSCTLGSMGLTVSPTMLHKGINWNQLIIYHHFTHSNGILKDIHSECHRLVTFACQNIVSAACEWHATQLKLTSPLVQEMWWEQHARTRIPGRVFIRQTESLKQILTFHNMMDNVTTP